MIDIIQELWDNGTPVVPGKSYPEGTQYLTRDTGGSVHSFIGTVKCCPIIIDLSDAGFEEARIINEPDPTDTFWDDDDSLIGISDVGSTMYVRTRRDGYTVAVEIPTSISTSLGGTDGMARVSVYDSAEDMRERGVEISRVITRQEAGL